MNEVEVKILEINRSEVVKKLLSLGAEKIFEGEICDTFFDRKDLELKRKEAVLRLRKLGSIFQITFKAKIPSEDLKIRDETEIEVSSYDSARKIIENLGYFEFASLKKRRISYKIENVRFEFDKLLDKNYFVPEFLEIEAENEDIICKYANLLGFSKKDLKPWTGNELIEYYRDK